MTTLIKPGILSGKGREQRAGGIGIRRGLQAVKPGRGGLERIGQFGGAYVLKKCVRAKGAKSSKKCEFWMCMRWRGFSRKGAKSQRVREERAGLIALSWALLPGFFDESYPDTDKSAQLTVEGSEGSEEVKEVACVLWVSDRGRGLTGRETRPTQIEGSEECKEFKEVRALYLHELKRISRKGAKRAREASEPDCRKLGAPARLV